MRELHGRGYPGLLWLAGLGASLFSWNLLQEAGKGGCLSAPGNLRRGGGWQTQRTNRDPARQTHSRGQHSSKEEVAFELTLKRWSEFKTQLCLLFAKIIHFFKKFGKYMENGNLWKSKCLSIGHTTVNSLSYLAPVFFQCSLLRPSAHTHTAHLT